VCQVSFFCALRLTSARLRPAASFAAVLSLVAALFTGLGVSTSSPAAAETGAKRLSVVLLGDSYSAGNGAGAYYGPDGSFRSHNNWAHTYVNWLGTQGVHATLTNLAWSGNITDDVLNRQIGDVPSNTDLVLMT